MGQQPKKKLVVLEVSPVAVSRDNRRNPEESEREQNPIVQRVRLRSRQHQIQQQQPLRRVVMRTVYQPPLELRPRPEPLKRLRPRLAAPQPPVSIRPHLQSTSKINPQRPRPRAVRGTQFPQNPEPRVYRTQEGYPKQDQKLNPNQRINPWAVNPTAKIEKFPAPALKPDLSPNSIPPRPKPNPFAKATPTPSPAVPRLDLPRSQSNKQNNKNVPLPSSVAQGAWGAKEGRSGEHSVPGRTGGDRENQNPKLINLSRGRKRRSPIENPIFPLFKKLIDSRNRRRENQRSRIAATVPNPTSPVGTTAAQPISQTPNPQSSANQKNRTSRRPQKRPLSPWVYIIRLLIIGIGIGAIAGTLLSALEPSTQASVKTKDSVESQVQESPSATSNSTQQPLGQEITPLKAKIQTLVAQYPQLQAGVFLLDLETRAYLDLNSDSTFASASTIKLPILIALFQDVEAGKVRLDESLTLKPEMRVGGSGDLQYKKPGTEYILLEVAKKMIAISDNTATNMLIERLGGIEALDQRFHSWGLTTTVLRNVLPDLEGTNTTSPKELANLMLMVNQGRLVSERSRDRIIDIMQQTQTNTLLPKGLGVGATIAHKTGTLGSLLADIGMVDLLTGKRYIVSVMVKRPHNDIAAEELIRQISRTTYDYFNQPLPTPSTTSVPSGSSPTANRANVSDTSFN